MIRTGSACVPDQGYSGVSIERIDKLSIVSLRVARKSLERARDIMQLAPPLCVTGGEPRSLWLGPDRWLLVSDSTTAVAIVRNCEETLAGILHNAVDNSAALTAFRISGPGVRDLLASGCGIDFRAQQFPAGNCCRTHLAQIAAVIVAETREQFDVYVDRSYETYLNDWLGDAASICAHRDRHQFPSSVHWQAR
jgi:heterotetrameric sarcosine oxidase gamma subunit